MYFSFLNEVKNFLSSYDDCYSQYSSITVSSVCFGILSRLERQDIIYTVFWFTLQMPVCFAEWSYRGQRALLFCLAISSILFVWDVIAPSQSTRPTRPLALFLLCVCECVCRPAPTTSRLKGGSIFCTDTL